ncbi:MAG: hypothetical protein GY764_07165, partial [Halieaceae bacterium]|nr:hypothetical protein [Halieaceae bacterium]
MLTSDIMADVMSYQYKTSKEEAYTALEKEGFSNALKAEYVKGMTAQWTAGGESAVTVKALRQQEELVSSADANLESAVIARDITLALDVIDDAVELGVYTVGEGITKKQGLPAQIDFQEYSQALQSDSIAELEGVSLTIWSDSNDMPNDMRASFQAKYENRITKLTNKHA